MIIDNGERRQLTIQGVFEGLAGVSRGQVAFTPNRIGKPAALARGALLDGEPIALFEVQLAEDGRSYTARYELLG